MAPDHDAHSSPVGTAPRPPVGLYLHVPFCVSLCPYCDFVVYTGRTTRGPTARVGAFVEAVKVELDLRADGLDADFGCPGSVRRPALDSVYLGGGTPSLLPAADVAALLERIERRYGLEADAEVTIEANPGPDERGDLAGFRAAGVTRVSFGAQSLDAAELRRLGRRHRPVDVVEAVAARASCRHRAPIDRPAVRHPGPVDGDVAGHGRAGARPAHRPRLGLRPDARRPRRRGPDRGVRRPSAGPTGGPPLASRRRHGAGRRSSRRPVPVARRAPPTSGLRLVRGLQLGAAGRREPAQPGVLAPPADRRRRSGCARLRRWPAPDLERGPA